MGDTLFLDMICPPSIDVFIIKEGRGRYHYGIMWMAELRVSETICPVGGCCFAHALEE